MNCYTSLISSHPFVILVAVAVFSVSCIIISLTTIKFPDFSDPQLGFEARGTVIANRLTAWHNLLEATSASGQLTLNPLEDKRLTFRKESFYSQSPVGNVNHNHNKSQNDLDTWSSLKKLEQSSFYDEDDEEEDNFYHDHDHLSDDGFFCGSGPGPGYSRIVISCKGEEDLMSLSNLKHMCELEKQLTNSEFYNDICENVHRGECCQPWSLPNYVAMLHNRTSCFDITEDDVLDTKELLRNCSKFYYNLNLMPDTNKKEVPLKCHKHDAVYSLMHYILDVSYIPAKDNESGDLKNTMIFLPIARSSVILNYYYDMENMHLQQGNIYISAIDFGLKNTLFDVLLVRDTWLIAMGALFVLSCMWLYIGSLFITFMTMVAIAFSLGIAYFIYTLIFELHFFPFMNLLASIVAIGIGADDAFIITKMWQRTKANTSNLTINRMVHISIQHSALSMFVTTVTTAAAFFSSYISAITSIRCFSVFAGTAVIVNYALMVTWLPASIVVAENMCIFPISPPPSIQHTLHNVSGSISTALTSLQISSVLHLRYLNFCILAMIAMASVGVVCYWPKLRLPDSPNFQLFTSSHPFEQYDAFYKHKFWFEKTQKIDTGENINVQMPLRFVWGVVPEDNGDYFDPASRGSLKFDPKFDIAAPDSQVWLLNFCHNLKAQPFSEVSFGPLLPNCFIESFVDWMNRRCLDPIDHKSRAPCCESAKFPFTRRVFNLCLARAIADLYRTPRELFIPGVAGPKFSRVTSTKKSTKVKALVVEYDSNQIFSSSYKEMHSFFTEVENWSKREMFKAPPGMRNGFFVSQLAFYDVQQTLAKDTVVAIAMSLAVTFIVLLIVTLNFLLSFYSILSITCIIFVTVAVLVIIGWKLNVLESVAISVAIGLAVDFSLHYAVSYRSCPDNESRESCVEHALQTMSGPTLMAALTTASAGAFMLPSSVLAYIQIGVFLCVVMVVSWVYSSYFLMSLLAVVGPQHNFGQLSYTKFCRLLKRSDNVCQNSDNPVYVNVLSESTSSTMCALHTSIAETHELENLTLTRRSCSQRSRRSFGMSQPNSQKVTMPTEQSPSTSSAVTVIQDDLNPLNLVT